jgi:two-component system, NtrC family, response regulator AtoC
MKRILLIDSEDGTRNVLRGRLQADGHEVIECDSMAQTLEAVRQGADAVVICKPPNGMTPVQLLQELHVLDPEVPVVMACSSTDDTLDALNEGAFYVTRSPVSADEIAIVTRRALNGEERVRRVSSPPSGELKRVVLIGETPEVRGIRNAIQRLSARPSTTVLIIGESGSGKDTIARLLHSETNQGGPFVDMSGLGSSEASREADLFGSEINPKEVRPGLLEQADSGTLFLGEITDLPLSLQTKLLRFVQERTFRRVGGSADIVSHTRVVATSSRNLDVAVRDGLLRPELAYRLAVVTLEIPPLRERRGDIPLLVEHFISSLPSKSGVPLRGVTEAAMKRLVEHSWPGNVRELANVLESATLLTDAERLDVSHLPPLSVSRPGVEYRLPSQGIDFRELEREVLTQALRLASGNQTRAALLLGLTRDQIRYRMAKFGMSSRDATSAGERAA